MTEQLKPCPFCKAPAQSWMAFPKFQEPWVVSVDHEDFCPLFEALDVLKCHETEADLVEWWNRRAPDPEAEEISRVFNMQWDADMRAVALWREANPGNDLVLPDRCNLTVWALEQMANARRTVSVQEAGKLHYAPVIGGAARDLVADAPDALRKMGDVWLIFVNEGDLANLTIAGKAVDVRALAEGERG